jgi:hypothetical protein
MNPPATMFATQHETETPLGTLRVWTDVAQAQVAETVIDAFLFTRPRRYEPYSTNRTTDFVELFKLVETRDGGLPQHFVLAVTAEEVIALERTMTARGPITGEPGAEVARWPRSELRVSWKTGEYLLDVTFAPSDGDRVECSVPRSPLSESFLTRLAESQ